MIPKIIHYCWFGRNPKPKLAERCIASWKKYCPDYEIVMWNESNFDVNCCDYVREAFEKQKWAFVSDYARFWILYHYGGLYFDTDVEIIKPLDDLISKGAFMACEAVPRNVPGQIAPGLGIAAASGHRLYKEILEFYEEKHFVLEDGSQNMQTIVEYTTELLKTKGFIGNGSVEIVEGIYIYPPEYFCPMSYYTGITTITRHTYTIHHYTASWKTEEEKQVIVDMQKYSRIFGNKLGRNFAEYKMAFAKNGIPGILGLTQKKIEKRKNKEN